MYRIVFFKIPFMRGGYRVPATPFGDKPIEHMGNYKVAEVVTDMAFSEQQRQILLAHDTAVQVDNGAANFCYVAYTSTSEIGNYEDDSRPSYYWVDDIEFFGVPQGENEPAAMVTISPDVWLTDFFPNTPTVRGRLAQSSNVIATSPREPTVSPQFQYGAITVTNALAGTHVRAVGFFVQDDGEIICLARGAMQGFTDVQSDVQYLGTAARYLITEQITKNIKCLRIYIVPEDFFTLDDGTNIFNNNDAGKIETSDGIQVGVFKPRGSKKTFYQMQHVFDIDGSDVMGVNDMAYIATPSRFIEIVNGRGVSFIPSGETNARAQFAASVYISLAPSGENGMQILFLCGNEFIDVSDDFMVDFAVNDDAVRQAQHKQLFAVRNITGAIGAIGGAVGGAASGNYFGVVQSIAGGAEQIVSRAAERKSPANVTGSGDAMGTLSSVNMLVYFVKMSTIINGDEVSDAAEEFGYVYTNNPYVRYDETDPMPRDDYYRFSVVDVTGMTGGTTAAEEVATAFTNGVRLVSL